MTEENLAPVEQSKHHKHCSSWTVNTSGERQPCDCVCECTHSMCQHIRPGEHYWYEDCAVEGCPCMKFTAPASPAALRDEADALVDEVQHRMDQVVEAAVEWHQAGRIGGEWMDAAERLTKAIDSLLELRGNPQNMPRRCLSGGGEGK